MKVSQAFEGLSETNQGLAMTGAPPIGLEPPVCEATWGQASPGLAMSPERLPQSDVKLYGLDILRVEENDHAISGNLDGDICDEAGWEGWKAMDDVKGGELPPSLVHQARVRELAYLRNRCVFEYTSLKKAVAAVGKRPPTFKMDRHQ